MTREQLERIKDEAAAKGRALTADEMLASATGTIETNIAAERAAKAPRGAPMTPAEIAAAKILAAWNEWRKRDKRSDTEYQAATGVMLCVGDTMHENELALDNEVSAKGHALLLRARTQGHLP